MAKVTINLPRPINGQSTMNYDDSEFQSPEEAINYAMQLYPENNEVTQTKSEQAMPEIDYEAVYGMSKKQADTFKKQMEIVKGFEYPEMDIATREDLGRLSALAKSIDSIRNASTRKKKYLKEFNVDDDYDENVISELMSGNLFKKLKSGVDTGPAIGEYWRATGAPKNKDTISDSTPILTTIMSAIDPSANKRRRFMEK